MFSFYDAINDAITLLLWPLKTVLNFLETKKKWQVKVSWYHTKKFFFYKSVKYDTTCLGIN